MNKVNKKESYHRDKYYNVRKAILFFGILMLVLLLSALYLGLLSAKNMKEIIRDDFNKQQLILARYATHRIEDSMELIKRELSLLSLSPSIQYLEVSWASRMNTSLSSVKEQGVIQIRLIDKNGETAYVLDNRGVPHIIKDNFRDTEFFKWALLKENKKRIYMGKVTKESEQYPEKLVMILAAPTYEESIDEAYPKPSGRLSGVILFTVDVTHLVRKAVGDIRSGKTGYAWT